jgi:hypothetical protein
MHHSSRHQRPELSDGRRRRARWLVTLALASISLLAASCAGNSPSHGVASVESTTTTAARTASAGNSGTSSAGALAYARCMRSHGLTDFPDPNPQGGFDDLPSNISFASPSYVSANKACQPLNGGGRRFSEAEQQQLEAKALKFAQCMRIHGVPDYPDPAFNFSGGGMSETQRAAGGSLNDSSPQFQAAKRHCQATRNGGDS